MGSTTQFPSALPFRQPAKFKNPANTVIPHSNRDREFHLDMESITITDTTAPTLVSIGDNASGGPICADQVQVIYTLTFNETIQSPPAASPGRMPLFCD